MFLFAGEVSDFSADRDQIYARRRRATIIRAGLTGLVLAVAALIPAFYEALPIVGAYLLVSAIATMMVLARRRTGIALILMGAVDISLISYAVHLTGSLTTVVVVLYPLLVVLGTLFAGLRIGFVYAGLGSFAYTSVVAAEGLGWLPYSPVFGHDYPAFRVGGIPMFPVVVIVMAHLLNFGSVVLSSLVVYALEKRRREAHRALNSRTELAAICSHDLKNLLASVMGHAEIAEMRLQTGDREAVQSGLVQIRKSSDRMMELVRDLLDLARLEAGQIVLSRSRFDLAVTVRGVVQSQQANARLKNITLEAELPEDGPVELTGDQSKMIQVLTNLVQNAIRHTPEGGRVTVGLWSEGTDANLSVTDSGPGIAADEASGLFDTGSLTRRWNESGRHTLSTGLGLNIVRRITDLHGGRVWVESPDGGGARFRIELPAG